MKNKSWLFALALCIGCSGFGMEASAQDAKSQEVASAEQTQEVKTALDPSQKLPQAIEDRFKAIRSDPDPDELVRGAHYWISNENAHYVWYPIIKDMGGVLSGVGTDQVYLLAGWANSAIVLPMDFDRMIRNLHIAYGAAFMASETIEEFRSYWKKDGAEKMQAALEKYFPDEAKVAMKSWKSAYREVNNRFGRLVKKYSKKDEGSVDVPTFITDETQYKRIRQLWLNHRVIPLCGDLTGDKTMIDMAKALRDSGLSMTLLYPSNAEHYFEYGPTYRRNILNMPFADNSLVLRTRQMQSLGLAEDQDYHYNMQSGENFQLWLRTTQIGNQHKMLRKRSKTKTQGLSVMDTIPTPSSKQPEIAPMP